MKVDKRQFYTPEEIEELARSLAAVLIEINAGQR